MAEEYGKIRKSLLTDIADSIRAKKNTTETFTPEQMAVEISGIGEELPNAEDAAFGIVTTNQEYGIQSLGASQNAVSTWSSLGWCFTAAEAFSIIGFRFKHTWNYSKWIRLWDSSGNIVASIDTSGETTDWANHYLDTPINVAVGETYTVMIHTGYVAKVKKSGTVFNSKLSNIEVRYAENYNTFPTGTGGSSNIALVDIIMSPVTEGMPNSYEIQRITMDNIAEEVQRITGMETKMSTSQIQSGLESVILQDKTVTSSSQDMTVTPDAAYYGLSSVTVEALPSAEDENFGGVDNTNEYVIQGETMDNIAKAIQNKKDTTAIFTPEQMAVEIEGIVVGNNLPEAEYASFGNSTLEYGKDKTSVSMQSGTEKDSVGYKFTPKEAFAVYGLYAYATTGSYVQLWDEDAQTLLAEVQIPDGTTEEVMLPAPINVIPGKNYIVCCYSTSRAFTTSATPTFSDKFTVKAWGFSSEGRSICPNYSSTGGMIGSADIIIGKAITESTVQEYKIQVETLDSIASEVQRITGTEATMSPAQIITALQGMAVQTAE